MSGGVVLFAANRGYALKNSREGIIKRLISSGHEVVLATADDRESRYLESLGASLEPIQFNRGGLSAGADVRTYLRMRQIVAKRRPRLIHHFHAKPVIIGSLAARRVMGARVRIVNTITGLGHAFIVGGVAARLAGLGYKLALPRSDLTIFQNSDDRRLFQDRGWTQSCESLLVRGSGVDIARFQFVDRTNRPTNSPLIVMAARLLRQKGIGEFVEVARRIKGFFPSARFVLAGEEDPRHPDAITANWVRQQSAIEYVGRLDDLVGFLEEADMMLFTSYYREGVPRVIMEAAAMGLPTVAFNVPGVREAVHDGETGFLEKKGDLDGLTHKVQMLLESSERRHAMGRAARQLAAEAFDIHDIEAQYYAVYRSLGLSV